MVLAGNGPQLHRPAPDKSVLGRKSLGWTRRGAGHRCPETAGTRRAIPASPSRVPGPIPGAHPTPPVAREVMPPDPGFRAAEAQDPYLGRKRASPSSPWGRRLGARLGGAGHSRGRPPSRFSNAVPPPTPARRRPRCPPEKRPLRPPRAPRRAQGRRSSLGLGHASLVCSPGAREGTRQILEHLPRTDPLC